MRHYEKQPKLKHNALHEANRFFDWNVLLTLRNSIISLDGSSNETLEDNGDIATFDPEDEKQQIAIDRLEAEIDVKDALKQLTDIEVDVIRFRYGMSTGEPQSFIKIGNYFGFSTTKATKIHNTAIQKLRDIFSKL